MCLDSILQLILVGDFCGRQLNTSQSTSSNIVDIINMFNLLSSSNTTSNYAPIINTRAPPSTPSILTKHIKSIPENIAKNDVVYYRHDKDTNKTTNGNELSLPTEARTRLYELAKREMGMDKDDLHRSHDGLVSAKWETLRKARLWRAMGHTFQKHGASMDLGRLRAGLASPLTEVKPRASHTF